MATVHDDDEIGSEEGMLWLPSHIPDEAFGTKVHMRNHQQSFQNHQQMHQQRHHKSLGEPKSQYTKSTPRSSYQRPKLVNGELVNGGPGMQAIFLGYGRRSCGTGVFLPQRTGTNFQPRKWPACATVLLPVRVVQALNLNVHGLGVQTSPPQVRRSNPRCGEACYSIEKKSDPKDVSKQCSFISQNQSSSPEIFLPKEWTY